MNVEEPVELKDLISINEARKRLPTRNGKRVDLSQLYRWAKRGVGGVRLQTVKVGGVMFTSEAWLWAFLDRDNQTTQRSPSPSQQRKELDRIEAELASMGLM